MADIKNSTTRYGQVAMALHWLMAVLILYMAWLGLSMEDLPEKSAAAADAMRLHQSIGLSVLLLAIFRLLWRLINVVPAPPANQSPLLDRVATATHWLFYGFMIGAPLAGWATASLTPNSPAIELFGTIPWPHFPGLTGMASEANEHLMHEVHEIIVFAMLGLLVLHVAAALWHHWQMKDDSLRRMLPWT